MDWFSYFGVKKPDQWQLQRIENLIYNANLSIMHIDSLDYSTYESAETTIRFLEDNQLCRIMSGKPYGQSDISRKIYREI